MRAVDNLLKIPSAWVFRVCSSKNSTQVSSLLEETQTYPVIIILLTFFCLWLTHCSNGYRFHTTTGNKRYFKTWLFTRFLVIKLGGNLNVIHGFDLPVVKVFIAEVFKTKLYLHFDEKLCSFEMWSCTMYSYLIV